MSPRRRTRRWLALWTFVLAAACTAALAPVAWAPPGAPQGLTAFAEAGRVTLAWQASAGASSYTVARGTNASNFQVVRSGLTATTWTDTAATNNTTWYYIVRAESGTGSSPWSVIAGGTPRSRSCSTGSKIVLENCLAGGTGWKVTGAAEKANGGFDAFTTKSSIAAGQSVGLKVSGPQNAPYRVDIWRTGWYGGNQGRLVGSVLGLRASSQVSCPQDAATGLVTCSLWSTAVTLSTTTAWPSGVYLLKLVRTDTGAANYTLLTVRDDSRVAPVAFNVPVSTYQAYNNYGGRSLYSWNSWGPPTVSGAARAVKVSFDRPYTQPVTDQHDFYTASDVQTVSWLERQGYDVSYLDSTDVNSGRGSLTQRKAIVLGSHDEYQSQQMRDALTSARNSGAGIASLGANTMYWRARFESSERTLVSYKTTEGGAADPSTPTTTWRDPAGANNPENALFGGMYVGHNPGSFFPLYVTAEQGKHRVWRYTSLGSLQPGSTAQIGFRLVGWEWDRRVENGLAPAGVQAVSASPVNGDILQDAGRTYSPGSELAEATVYTAASGAKVFSAGTNHWAWGLANNVDGVGEPDGLVQQATANVLGDMGASAATPSGVTLDASGRPLITTRTPAPGATGVPSGTTVRVGFDRALDPGTVTADQLVVRRSGGAAVAGSVSYDATARAVTFTPDESLNGFASYDVTVGTGLRGWNGQGLASAATWTFSTGTGVAPTVTSRSPAAGASAVTFDAPVQATFSRSLDPATVNDQNVQLSAPSGAVPAQVGYDAASRRITLTPTAPLASATTYTARLTTEIKAADGTPLATQDSWTFTTFEALEVTGRTPAPFASGISTRAVARAVFSRPVDPATLTASSFTLTDAGGQPAPGSVTYDAGTRTATLVPGAELAAGTTYTARLAGVRAADGAPLQTPVTWTFTTALTSPPAPAPTALVPAAGATSVPLDGAVRVSFDQALDPGSVSPSSFTLTAPGGAIVAADTTYDDATATATLSPHALLASDVTYTARVASSVRSSLGQPLAGDITWAFTTGGCPCSTMSTLAPEQTGISTVDGRPGPGPFSRELGVKLAVDQPTLLTALKFFKSPGETGTHVGRLWTATGGRIASVTFQGETASGWQRQDLDSPVTLQPGRTYVASVGANSYYVTTRDQLAVARVAGPLRTVADGANGVFGDAAGAFPEDSWRNSNYFVDAVVETGAGGGQAPEVTTTSPADGATGVNRQGSVKASFSVPLDAQTVSAQAFTLRKSSGGPPVGGAVSYDEDLLQAKLVPAATLDPATEYVARLDTSLTSHDGTPLAAAYTWRFITSDDSAPTVTATSPVDDAALVSPTTDVRATFAQALDPASVNGASFLLSGPGGGVGASVSYEGASRTAVLVPAAPLAPSSVYTATLTTGVRNSDGVPLAAPVSWSFTTSACPCSLFGPGAFPAATGRPVRDGRPDPGPWSYEMGVKVRVTQAAKLSAIRFYKSPGEAGTHVGRLWTAAGAQVAQVTFAGESSSGWQEQQLAAPVQLTPGQTYVVSVGINDFYVTTGGGLSDAVVSGPLESVADGANGVFGGVAGSFPTDSWGSSNYFIDAVVR